MTTTITVFIAVCMIESGLNPAAVNRPASAYGPAQIRQDALRDINRHAGTNYSLEDFLGNLALSRWAFYRYGQIYGARTWSEFARIWRAGRDGMKNETATEYVRRIEALTGMREEDNED